MREVPEGQEQAADELDWLPSPVDAAQRGFATSALCTQ